MNWIKININKLPKGEVLAANFKPYSYGYKEKLIGYLSVTDEGNVDCEDDYTMLSDCTHYIPINDFDLKEDETDNPPI